MKSQPRQLTEAEIRQLQRKYTSLIFQTDFDFTYEHQVPNTGIILLNGKLNLLKRKKVVQTLGPGTILGVKHLLNNVPLPNGCKVIAPSEVIILTKTDIIEALKKKDHQLQAILQADL